MVEGQRSVAARHAGKGAPATEATVQMDKGSCAISLYGAFSAELRTFEVNFSGFLLEPTSEFKDVEA